MKQYFVKGIEDEPLEYGDVVGVDLVKESDDKTKTITRHVETPFTEATKDILLDLDVIEEKDIDDSKPTVEDVINGLDKEDEEPDNDDSVEESIDNINESISEITDILSRHQAIIKKLMHKVEVLEKKKEPIDVFGNSPYKPNPFEPIITALCASL